VCGIKEVLLHALDVGRLDARMAGDACHIGRALAYGLVRIIG
jgi:hypothetical protein